MENIYEAFSICIIDEWAQDHVKDKIVMLYTYMDIPARIIAAV